MDADFKEFREKVRSELEGLIEWANENSVSSHQFISSAWAEQVSAWGMSRLAGLDAYEDQLDGR